MAILDLLGRRMALRILWELSEAQAPLTFRALEEVSETNPALLNTRLKELRAARVLEHGPGGYALNPLGRELVALLLPLGRWAQVWARAVEAAE